MATSAHRSTTTRLIGAFKMVKAVVLVAVGVGALKLVHHDVASRAWDVIRQLHVDPAHGWVTRGMHELHQVDDHKLHEVTAATFVYALLFGIEGVGLLMDRRWGHWFTVVVTGSFVPFEVLELVKHFTAIRLLALIVNIAIVVYLVVRIVRESPSRRRSRAHGSTPLRRSTSTA